MKRMFIVLAGVVLTGVGVCLSSLKEFENSNAQEPLEDSAALTVDVKYLFERALTKEEADTYINNMESVGIIKHLNPSDTIPTDNFNSNFLNVGTKIYITDKGMVAVYEDGDEYYACLLKINPNVYVNPT